MKRTIALLSTLLLFSTNVFADLSRYTAEELMEEVGRRVDAQGGGTGGGPNETFELNFTCSHHIMSLSMISRFGSDNYGQISNENSSQCRSQMQKLQSRFNGILEGFKAVDVCAYHIQHTLKVTADGIKLLSKTSHNNVSDCLAAIGLN